MTGFVFTFSLFCTALLQTDAAVLTQVELAPVRQIIDAVLPDARPQSFATGRQHLVPPVSPAPASPASSALHGTRLRDGIAADAFHPLRLLRARPIRAPSAA